MKQTNYSIKRRLGVIITFLSLIGVVFVYEYGISGYWNNILKITDVILLTMFMFTFRFTFVKTGLWRFTHKSIDKLDEREVVLTSKSLRFAYSIFTVVLLLILLGFSFFNRSLSMVLVAALIIFAHLLPASVLAWTERGEM